MDRYHVFCLDCASSSINQLLAPTRVRCPLPLLVPFGMVTFALVFGLNRR